MQKISIAFLLIPQFFKYSERLLQFANETAKITDTHPNLLGFLSDLEKVHNFGLIPRQRFFKRTQEALLWPLELAKESDNLGYRSCVENVLNCLNVHTINGKLRLFLRHCLVRKCLQAPLELLVKNGRNTRLYNRNSIIGDEILVEIFRSVLVQCGKIKFDLDLDNSGFLDFGWELPRILHLELVPTRSLGLGISFTQQKALVVNIEMDSVVAEDGHIEIGDVLDNLNGIPINHSSKGRLNTILNSNKSQPNKMTIYKGTIDGHRLFPPIRKLLEELSVDLKKCGIQRQSKNKNDKRGFNAIFCGKLATGTKGNVKEIDRSIKRFLTEQKNAEEIEVCFDIKELGLRILDAKFGEILLEHSYMQISSCGSTAFWPNYFGYIAGDENCEVATNFQCYIFRSVEGNDATTILQSIGQGFRRTHFAV